MTSDDQQVNVCHHMDACISCERASTRQRHHGHAEGRTSGNSVSATPSRMTFGRSVDLITACCAERIFVCCSTTSGVASGDSDFNLCVLVPVLLPNKRFELIVPNDNDDEEELASASYRSRRRSSFLVLLQSHNMKTTTSG